MIDEVRKLIHTRQLSGKIEQVKDPKVHDMREGTFKIAYIQGRGLYIIARYNNKLRYIQFSESL